MVELLLVLVVIGLLAAIAFPILHGSYERYRLKEQVELVRTELARARLKAVDTGVAYQFLYEPNGEAFVVVPFEFDSDVVPAERGSGGVAESSVSLSSRYPMVSMKLPKGFTFESDPEIQQTQQTTEAFPLSDTILKELPNARELAGVAWSSPIVFRPEGEAEALVFSFIVKDEQKRYMRLSVRAFTGAVSVGPVQQAKR